MGEAWVRLFETIEFWVSLLWVLIFGPVLEGKVFFLGGALCSTLKAVLGFSFCPFWF